MIRISVSAILTVKDGFTGRSLDKKSISFTLDQEPYRPESRPGGLFVFTNLHPGPHELTASGAYFRRESLSFTVMEGAQTQLLLSMSPNERYPFGGRTTKLTLSLRKGKAKEPLPGEAVIVAPEQARELKIAQDTVEAGSDSLRLYYSGSQPALPMELLLRDKKATELCVLTRLEGDVGKLQAPVRFAHKRGCVLLPCQLFHTDGEGALTVYYKNPCPVELFVENHSFLQTISLEEGENSLELVL